MLHGGHEVWYLIRQLVLFHHVSNLNYDNVFTELLLIACSNSEAALYRFTTRFISLNEAGQ